MKNCLLAEGLTLVSTYQVCSRYQGRAEIARVLVNEGKMDVSDRHSDGHTPIQRCELKPRAWGLSLASPVSSSPPHCEAPCRFEWQVVI
jgi:hypothetical protein